MMEAPEFTTDFLFLPSGLIPLSCTTVQSTNERSLAFYCFLSAQTESPFRVRCTR